MLGAFFSYFAIQSVESRQWKGSFYSLAFASFITSISMNIAMTVKPKQSTNSIAAMKAKSKIK